MNGVTIQAEHVYRDTPIAGTAFIVVVTILLLAWLLWSTINCFRKNTKDKWGTAGILAFALVMLFPINVYMVNGSCTVVKDLVVTIDDNVGFNEFFDRYEIVGQDGNLYTVRELETEEYDYEGAVG